MATTPDSSVSVETSSANVPGPQARQPVIANRVAGSGYIETACVVQVLVPRAVHLGLYSYFLEQVTWLEQVAWCASDVSQSVGEPVPKISDIAKLAVGCLVEVPFGKNVEYGVVVGEGDRGQATRNVRRIGPAMVSDQHIEYCRWVATRWCSTLGRVLLRSVPKEILKKGASVLDMTLPVQQDFPQQETLVIQRPQYISIAPLYDRVGLLRKLVEECGSSGQTMIVCPTVSDVIEIAEKLSAVRMDSGHGDKFNTWLQWRTGETKVGVATRSQQLYEGYNVTNIIVVEDAHPGHREPQQPYTNSRDLLIGLAQHRPLQTTIVGAVPGPEALWGGTIFHELGSKTRDWPNLYVLEHNSQEQRYGIARTAYQALENSVAGEAMIVVPGGKVVWRCARCKEPWRCRRCGSEIAVGGCACPAGADAATCVQCNGERRFLTGWNRARVEHVVKRAALPQPDIYEMRELVQAAPHKIAVVLDAENYRSWKQDPGMESVRVVLRAAKLVGSSGTVYICGARSSGAVAAVGRKRSVKTVAKWGWARAKQERLVPFQRDVVINVAGNRKPVLDGLNLADGRVHGPYKMGDSWRYNITCGDGDLLGVAESVERLRQQRFKLRVEVH